ncbi:nuclear transport factor 2 family protein [Rugamonas rubra]|uniref:Ketosteroid isomerase homolog n=1 Tax=Rugamonas rubra TaxID=758825 RepID=A0A1I4MHW2_9BURK|nr:nuclear transport factor 2 family protein [Rugamonas rubra]SFM02676.1 Ketosteroid isomerase homolog [Rugamonas rubra]
MPNMDKGEMELQEQQLAAVEEQLRRAMLASDVAQLDALIADQLVFTDHTGRRYSKQDDLAAHRSGVLRFTALEPSEQLLRIDGPVAIVSVRMRLAGSFATAPFAADLRYTRLWRRTEQGGWRIIAGHSSAVAA